MLVGITQRVIISHKYGERRDALDQRWAHLLHLCGLIPYPIPNQIELLDKILKMPLRGVIFTGGNDLYKEAPERDQVENAILKYVVSQDLQTLPILGVCRGMQIILNYFGAVLQKVEGHVAVSHQICLNEKKISINSFHRFGACEISAPLQVLARAEDGVIEAVQHHLLPIMGLMWHPERNSPFASCDINILQNLFTKNREA